MITWHGVVLQLQGAWLGPLQIVFLSVSAGWQLQLAMKYIYRIQDKCHYNKKQNNSFLVYCITTNVTVSGKPVFSPIYKHHEMLVLNSQSAMVSATHTDFHIQQFIAFQIIYWRNSEFPAILYGL